MSLSRTLCTPTSLLLHTVACFSFAIGLTAGYITTTTRVGSNTSFMRITNVSNRYNNNENSRKNQQQRQSILFSSSQNDEEWYPRDPASTTPQLLSALWLQIAQGCKDLSKGVRTCYS